MYGAIADSYFGQPAMCVTCVTPTMAQVPATGLRAPLQAITHGMTTVATGGFANYDASFGHFNDKPHLLWISGVFMMLSALPLVLLVRLIGPGFGRKDKRKQADDLAPEAWQPDSAASVALLEDADRLAAEGRFDDATHLLLQRSVAQIAAARPGWVEPSSTARELAALPALPDAARTAFGVIATRVERSLFALTALDRADWDAARAAYAEFALARLDAKTQTA